MTPVEQLYEKFQDVISSLSGDLETGSHHGNNIASAAFNAKYPEFCKELEAFGELLTQLSNEENPEPEPIDWRSENEV